MKRQINKINYCNFRAVTCTSYTTDYYQGSSTLFCIW